MVEEKMEIVDPADLEEIDTFRFEFEELESELNKMIDVSDRSAFVSRYEKVLSAEKDDEDAIKIKEAAVYRLTKIHTDAKNFNQLMSLLKSCSNFFAVIPKAKTAKIVRSMLEIVGTSGELRDVSINLCKDIIDWCKIEKRNFLRQRIESKLATLLLLNKQPQESLDVVNTLLKELKKLDDKQMLTEVHLTESRVYHALQNIPKSKSSLTAARTNANSIYVAPVLQGELDEMSGTLYCEEGDNTTAYSYFQESFDAYDSASDSRAIKTLQYMALSKILSNHPEDVNGLLNTKSGMKYIGTEELDAIIAVSKAAIAKSLDNFKSVISTHHTALHADDLIAHHIDILYENMFESNLLKILSPYSSVEVAHVAKLINLDEHTVEKKLSQMILNRKFHGILDQGKGILEIFDGTSDDVAYSKSYEIIANMETVVDNLFDRVRALSTVTSVKPTSIVVRV